MPSSPAPTYWDDGNLLNGDGWDMTCTVGLKWSCPGGSPTTPSVWVDKWGDGFVKTPTAGYWDDGNNVNGDGWSSTCSVEAGWTWTLGDSNTASTCTDIWGDGKIMPANPDPSYCDDGNTLSGDGWMSTCGVGTKWTCSGGSPTTASVWVDKWGDGYVTTPAVGYWDDGNTINGDGCDSSCIVESNWQWTLGDTNTASSWTDIWGDGVVVITITDYCDDGNTSASDGCDGDCQEESGWNCTSGNSTAPSTCSSICGDGKTMSVDSAEDFCDDGNLVDGDGCSSVWVIESGYTWRKGTTKLASVWTKDDEMTQEVQNSIILAQSAMGAGTVAAVGISILNLSSPNSVWAMANQMQSLMLLVAMDIYLPISIVQFITASNFMNFSFDFLPIDKISFINSFLDWLDAEKVSSRYNSLGLTSRSTFHNLLSNLAVIILLVIIHLWMVLFPRKHTTEDSSWALKIYSFVELKLWNMFTFALYIRMVIESYQLMLLSSIFELYLFDLSNDSQVASFWFAGVIVVFWLGMFLLSIYDFKTQKYRCLSEFTSGIKNSKASKIFTSMYLLRKLLLIIWVVTSYNCDSTIIAAVATIVQALYMVILIFLRPFEEFQNNMIEILNEVIFTIVLGWLIIFDTESRWTSQFTDIYLYILIGNNIAIVAILLVCLLANSVIKIKRCISKKNKVETRVQRYTVSFLLHFWPKLIYV